MNISKLKGKPHMHIVRKWNRKTGKFYWAAEEQGCRSWPVATHVRGPDNHYAQAFVAYLNMKEDEDEDQSNAAGHTGERRRFPQSVQHRYGEYLER